MTHKQLFITVLIIILTGLIMYFAGFSMIFSLLSIALLIFFSYYFFHEENQMQQESLKTRTHQYLEEQEAHNWLKHTFAPRTSKIIRKKRTTIDILLGFLVALTTFFWNWTVTSFTHALGITVWVVVIYALVILYLQNSYKLLPHFPKLMRPYLNNDWIRIYILFLPVVVLLYLLSPYADLVHDALPALLGIPKVLFIYSAIFTALFGIMYFHRQNAHEEETHADKSSHR